MVSASMITTAQRDVTDLRAMRPIMPELAHVGATVTQFPTVHRARYSINGSEAAVHRWLERDVPAASTIRRTRGSLCNRAPIADVDGARLSAIRVGRHVGFDRVVFEFAGTMPSYDVRYRGVATMTSSGMPMPLRGVTALVVRMRACTARVPPDGPDATFYGQRTNVRYPTLRAVGYGGEFEGLSAFGLGVAGRTGFRVLELDHPTRLAIDVAHGRRARSLRLRHRGADVGDWQLQLDTVQHQFGAARRPAGQRLSVDGVFGPRTLQATRTLQRAEDFMVTGIVDTATHAAMLRALRRAAACDVSPAPGTSPSDDRPRRARTQDRPLRRSSRRGETSADLA